MYCNEIPMNLVGQPNEFSFRKVFSTMLMQHSSLNERHKFP